MHTTKDSYTSTVTGSTPVSVTTASTPIAAANKSRMHIILQNCGTEPCIVNLGATASTAAYNFVLSDCTANRDGLGASVTITNYQGAIYGIVENNTTVIGITEIV